MTTAPTPPPPDPRAPTARFTSRAEDYARYRPGYPAAAFDAILEGLGDPQALRAVDVGAGTGIAARALADRGVHVVAVEPNEAMRRQAAPHPRVEWRAATGERTSLPAASADLVLCAQSFHWLDPPAALAEFRRVLRPGGRVALMWNGGAPSDPAALAYYALTKAVAAEDPSRFRVRAPREAMALAGLVNGRTVVFPGGQVVDLEGLVGRARSASYMPREGPAYERLVAGLREIHARYARPDGTILLAYATTVHLAETPAVP